MPRLPRIGTCLALLLATGCASKPAATPTTQPMAVTTQPVSDKALLTLDQIEPKAILAAPTTRPAGRPPLEAVRLFAQARAAQLEPNPLKAIELLRKAIDLDTESAALAQALGLAYAGPGGNPDSAVKWLEKSARLGPDSLDTHYQLGRVYRAIKDDVAMATEHFRLAQQTSDYKLRPETAALVDFHLAQCLQAQGYDTAALEQYERVIRRLDAGLSPRVEVDVYTLLARQQEIFAQAGRLYERLGRPADALRLYQRAGDQEPNNFTFQSHIVHALLAMGRSDDARTLAADLVAGHRASPPSVDLLRKVYEALGREDDVVPELRRLQAKNPADRSIAFAIADTLAATGKEDQAEAILTDLLRTTNAEPRVVGRLFDFYVDRHDTQRAATLLIESLAKRPDAQSDIEAMWSRLTSFSTRNRLRLAMVQSLEVASEAHPAKLFLEAGLAKSADRTSAALAALERAVAARPAFPPAWRELLVTYFDRPDWPDDQKHAAADKLMAQASQAGTAGLADELRGLVAMHDKKYPDAVVSLRSAVDAGDNGAQAQFAFAAALLAAGKGPEAEQLLWKIASDYPSFDTAFMTLYQHYSGRRETRAQAEKVLTTWLAADPSSVSARLVQVIAQAERGQVSAAEGTLLGLFQEYPDNPRVLSHLIQFYTATESTDDLVRHLEQERARHPDNAAVVESLALTYNSQKRFADANRVLEELRRAVASDPDQLYFLAHLYERAGKPQMTEQILADVLRLDPKHVPASNDLGYLWADAGRNLDQAEAMARVAVEAEPDSSAYLDSLGWVLYKRGKFDEASKHLSAATSATDWPDPVVLDHLGDALYRLKQPAEALKVWQRSLERLGRLAGDNRDDLQKLNLQLKRKIRQQQAGQTVDVAPVVEAAATRPAQAKN